jgi:hypothetical protein
MKTPLRILSVAAGLAAIVAVASSIETAPDLSKVNEEMSAAATAFLASVSDAQKAKASFEWKDAERLNWHFIPRERKGLPIKELDEKQRALAKALLASGLSKSANEKALNIMSLESILKELEGPNGRMVRDPELYYFSIFGKPGSSATWGWRVEGHHLSLNFTIVGGKVVLGGPTFLGTNPAEVKSGPRQGTRVLGQDEDMARELVKSLDAEQQKEAVFAEKAPADILAMPGKVAAQTPLGLAASKMNEAQSTQLMKLIKEYANRLRGELAAQDIERAEKAGKEKLHFAWAGGLNRGDGHYYRVQGPGFIIEYDNTQNGANHVHSVWHDLANNFGEDALRKHVSEDHKK